MKHVLDIGGGRRRQVTWLLSVFGCLFLAGCGQRRTPPPVAQAPEPEEPAVAAPAEDEGGVQPSSPDGVDGRPAEDEQPTEYRPAPNEQTDVHDEPGRLERVGPEDARRGSSIAGGGIITEPIRQHFLIQHRIVFLNVEKALQLYEATKGSPPESHEEFMREVIEANDLQLPELQQGWEYFFDAEEGELKKRKVD